MRLSKALRLASVTSIISFVILNLSMPSLNNMLDVQTYITKEGISTLFEKNTASFDWNAMANQLCPNMMPQSESMGPILFALARQELGEGDAKCPGSHKTIQNNTTGDNITIPINDTMSRLFYTRWWGEKNYDLSHALGAMQDNGENSTSLEKSSVSYVVIWKCANDAIRFSLDSWVKNAHRGDNLERDFRKESKSFKRSKEGFRPRERVSRREPEYIERRKELFERLDIQREWVSGTKSQYREELVKRQDVQRERIPRTESKHREELNKRRDIQMKRTSKWESKSKKESTESQDIQRKLISREESRFILKKLRKKQDIQRESFKIRNNERNCFVTAVRDPLEHFFAGYNEIEYRILFKPETTYLRLPLVGKDGGWTFGQMDYTAFPRNRLRQFLVDFLSCPHERSYKGMDYKFFPQVLEIQHVFSMSRVLFHLHMDHVDAVKDLHYLPTIENLTNTLGPFVAEKCGVGLLKEKKIPNNLGMHGSSDRPEYKNYKNMHKENLKDKLSLQVVKALCAMHLMDYACWRDLPDGVPKVCMDLYASYHERGIIPLGQKDWQ
uniref:Sulfotransferase domain-containing protein n=1 Tax=Corethron hystrix TaxID=216773 RepID=A0A7S1FPH5_9STRA|mmetsp:Transcript_17272/g.38974  ORF Transcript_17272/g.38974 Transcript_17272/m.38974 type:complete len:557 (+) Transcript_17272:185-1855(+)